MGRGGGEHERGRPAELLGLAVPAQRYVAYVNPVVAVLAGIMFLGEPFTWREGLGAAHVLASVVITLPVPQRVTPGPRS